MDGAATFIEQAGTRENKATRACRTQVDLLPIQRLQQPDGGAIKVVRSRAALSGCVGTVMPQEAATAVLSGEK